MSRKHEKLLIATLAGMIIAGAAAFAIGPAFASSNLSSPALAGPSYEVLTLRLADRA